MRLQRFLIPVLMHQLLERNCSTSPCANSIWHTSKAQERTKANTSSELQQPFSRLSLQFGFLSFSLRPMAMAILSSTSCLTSWRATCPFLLVYHPFERWCSLNFCSIITSLVVNETVCHLDFVECNSHLCLLLHGSCRHQRQLQDRKSTAYKSACRFLGSRHNGHYYAPTDNIPTSSSFTTEGCYEPIRRLKRIIYLHTNQPIITNPKTVVTAARFSPKRI